MALFNKVTIQEKKDFVKSLSLIIRSGTPINEAFDILKKQTTSPVMRDTLGKAQERLEKGTPIHEVFEQDPNFETVFVSFIKAGEESGTLEESLNHLADWLEDKQTLESEIKSATLYPKIVLTFALVLGGSLVFFVLPRLVPIFATLDVDLPLISQMLLSFSIFVQEQWLNLLLGTIIFFSLLYLLSKVERVKEMFDSFILKVPFVGDFVRDHQLAIMSQIIATLFKSGIMVTNILDITEDSMPNRTFKKSIQHIKTKVVKGDPFSAGLKSYPHLYPDVYVTIISTGEKTGSFVDSFRYLADFFTSKVTEKTKKIPVILEPLILILIGVIVAFVASAIILPVYQITQGLY